MPRRAIGEEAVGVDLQLSCPPCSLEPRSVSGCVVLPAGSSFALTDLAVGGARGEAEVPMLARSA